MSNTNIKINHFLLVIMNKFFWLINLFKNNINNDETDMINNNTNDNTNDNNMIINNNNNDNTNNNTNDNTNNNTNDNTNNNNITREDCLKWLQNRLVNPKTNRKIKENADTYNKFKKKSIEYGIYPIDNNNNNNDITREDCLKWLQNRLVNPKTNRTIKENRDTYNKFKKKSIEYGIYQINNDDNDIYYKKKKISLALKKNVWSKYIGIEKGISKCLCCKNTDIYQISFHCGHVIPEVKGGHTNVSNLRPICQNCNSSMGTRNMNEFMEQFA